VYMKPKVSVLLPVYNGCNEVSRAIDSVLDQTFLNFELIIIDDCSTDNTVEIVTEFINRDNRIKLYKNANNLGLTRTLNIAIRKSSGSLLARIDADDYWNKDKLLKQVAYFDSNKKCILCGTEYYIVSYDDVQMNAFHDNLDPKKMIPKRNPFAHSTAMFKRDVVLKIGGYDESYICSQDYKLWVDLIPYGDFALLKEKLAFISLSDKSITFTKFRKQKINSLRVKLYLLRRDGFSSNIFYIYREIFFLLVPRRMFFAFFKYKKLRKK